MAKSAPHSHAHPVERLAQMRHEFGEHGGVNMSIEVSSTFTVMAPDTMPALFEGQKTPNDGCYLYSRSFNPTVHHLSRQLAALEATEAAYCTASGMAAIAGAMLQACDAGDHIVCSKTIYGGTYSLTHDFLPRKAGIHTSYVDICDLAAVEAAMSDRTKVIYTESVSNPTLRVADIAGLSAIAKRHGAKLIVDNTFAPLLIAPAMLGADVVVHSLTKFINGASDIVAGAICGDGAFIGSLMDLHLGSLMILGPTMDPTIASKISLRIPHLPLRAAEHARRAQIFAERLEEMGLDVLYPGLARHPDHALLARQRCEDFGFGGLFTLDLGSYDRAMAFIDRLQNTYDFGRMAVSLGYFDTLMSVPGRSTSSEMSEDDLAHAGIRDGLVRFSLGYTGSLEQRWDQFAAALVDVGLGDRVDAAGV